MPTPLGMIALELFPEGTWDRVIDWNPRHRLRFDRFHGPAARFVCGNRLLRQGHRSIAIPGGFVTTGGSHLLRILGGIVCLGFGVAFDRLPEILECPVKRRP